MHDTQAARPQLQLSGSLLDAGAPGIVADPAKATQADAARAYAQTYAAWETAAANLAALRVVLEADGWTIIPSEKTTEKRPKSGGFYRAPNR